MLGRKVEKKTLEAKRKLHVALMNRREAGREIRVGGRGEETKERIKTCGMERRGGEDEEDMRDKKINKRSSNREENC